MGRRLRESVAGRRSGRGRRTVHRGRRYRRSPYEQPEVGHAAIRVFWRDDEGQTFTVRAQPVAVDGRDAVVRLEVRYGDPVRQEYRDLWVLRFAADRRVEDFEEWAYWPGQPYTANTDHS